MGQFSPEIRQAKIQYAIDSARKNLQEAIDHLNKGVSPLVEEYFGVAGTDASGTLQSLILKYSTMLNALSKVQVEYQSDSPPSYLRRGVTAWCTFGSPILNVIDEFFSQPRKMLSVTIIHEISHMFLHTRDHAYDGQVGGMAIKWLTPEQRQDNADSFAYFALKAASLGIS